MNDGAFNVTIRYFGILQLYAGTRSKTVQLPMNSTIQNLLDFLEQENPPAYQKLVGHKNRDESFLRVMLNESLIKPTEYTYLLHPNDVITLLPGISGGG